MLDSIGVFAALPPLKPSQFPLGQLAYDVMFDKPLLMLSAVPALGLLFLSIVYMDLPYYKQAGLLFLATWSIILAIPDMVWPLGTIYYEDLKYLFGLLSLFLAFSTVMLYALVSWRKA